MVVDVVPRRRKPLCGICGRKVRKNKDRYNRYWRHLDLFGVRTYLRYSIRRVVCRRCGVVREKVPWADKGSRFTKSFEQEVAWLAQRTDVSAVANYFRVTWRSVRRIIQRVVAEQRDERRELDGLRVIGMDENQLPQTPQVLNSGNRPSQRPGRLGGKGAQGQDAAAVFPQARTTKSRGARSGQHGHVGAVHNCRRQKGSSGTGDL